MKDKNLPVDNPASDREVAATEDVEYEEFSKIRDNPVLGAREKASIFMG